MPRASPVILLPPSEGKTEGGDEVWDAGAGAFGDLGRARRKVARRLAEAMADDAERLRKLLGVKGEALDRAIRANRRLIRQPASLPAAERFTGVVHDHLDLTSLSSAGDDVIFFSALAGLITPSDPLPDHRAKMSISLPPLGKLSTWWRPRIDEALGERLAGAMVVDLLPQEHAAAATPTPDRWAAWIQARFEYEAPDGTRKVVGHEAKAGKGLFARHLLSSRSADDETIRGFTTPDGWSVADVVEPDDPADGPRMVVVVRRDRPSS